MIWGGSIDGWHWLEKVPQDAQEVLRGLGRAHEMWGMLRRVCGSYRGKRYHAGQLGCWNRLRRIGVGGAMPVTNGTGGEGCMGSERDEVKRRG